MAEYLSDRELRRRRRDLVKEDEELMLKEKRLEALRKEEKRHSKSLEEASINRELKRRLLLESTERKVMSDSGKPQRRSERSSQNRIRRDIDEENVSTHSEESVLDTIDMVSVNTRVSQEGIVTQETKRLDKLFEELDRHEEHENDAPVRHKRDMGDTGSYINQFDACDSKVKSHDITERDRLIRQLRYDEVEDYHHTSVKDEGRNRTSRMYHSEVDHRERISERKGRNESRDVYEYEIKPDIRSLRQQKITEGTSSESEEELPPKREGEVQKWLTRSEKEREGELERKRRELIAEKIMLEKEGDEIQWLREEAIRKEIKEEMIEKQRKEAIRLERSEISGKRQYDAKKMTYSEFSYMRKMMKQEEDKKASEERMRQEIEAEIAERDRKLLEKHNLKRMTKERQVYEERQLLQDIERLKLDMENKESSSDSEDETHMEDRLAKLRIEQHELKDRLQAKKKHSPAIEPKEKAADRRFERPLGKPKLPTFDGEEFEAWKLEITSLVESKLYSEQILTQVIRNSLIGKARKVLLTLKPSAKAEEILTKMGDIYGNIRSGDSIVHDFYSAKQNKSEPCSEWAIRLETQFNLAVERGEIEESRKDKKLKERFWRGLFSENIKMTTRVAYESAGSFDNLRKKARIEELEMESEQRSSTKVVSFDTDKPKVVATESFSSVTIDSKACQSLESRSNTDAKLDILMKKIESVESSLEEIRNRDRVQEPLERTGNSFRGRYQQRYRGYNRGPQWNTGRGMYRRDDNSASRWTNRPVNEESRGQAAWNRGETNQKKSPTTETKHLN